MEQPLLTIGAFARAVGLTPSALRYYDECGLLPPAEVDEATSYRYYTPDLARRAQVVAQMRDAGISIEVMRAALDGTREDRRRILREVLAEQQALIARRTGVLEDLLAGDAPDRSDGTLTVDGPELAAAIRQVRVAADAEPTSPLAGVLLDVSDGAVDVVATNRYWMAVRTLAVGRADDVRVVIPLPEATRLSEALVRHERVPIELLHDQVVVGTQRFGVRDVAYPAHRMVLAGVPEATSRVTLARPDLLDAIDAVRHAEFDLTVTPDGITVGDRTVDGSVEGPPATLRFGSALLRRALECALGPEVTLRLACQTRPVRVTSPYQSGFVALVMPIADTPR